MTKEEIKNFCENIKALRRKYGLSEAEMAKKIGVGVETLKKIERGILPPNLNCEVMVAIFREFHLPPSYQLCKQSI